MAVNIFKKYVILIYKISDSHELKEYNWKLMRRAPISSQDHIAAYRSAVFQCDPLLD